MIRGDEMMISLEERYENFKKTIQECGSYLLTESDDTIKHNLFEEEEMEEDMQLSYHYQYYFVK